MGNEAEIILELNGLTYEIVENEVTTIELRHIDNDMVSELSDSSNIFTVEVQIVDGKDGKSAYQIWLDAGNTGTIQDFLDFISGTHIEVIQEKLIGEVDNINTIFVTSFPYKPGSIMIFLNGLKQSDVLEIDSETIELATPPSNDGFEDLVEAYYIKN